MRVLLSLALASVALAGSNADRKAARQEQRRQQRQGRGGEHGHEGGHGDFEHGRPQGHGQDHGDFHHPEGHAPAGFEVDETFQVTVSAPGLTDRLNTLQGQDQLLANNDAALEDQIEGAVTDSERADAALERQLEGAVDDREAGDEALQAQVNAVATNAQVQDLNLLQMVSNVAANAQAVDENLITRLDNVARNTEMVDGELQHEIYNVATNAENEDRAIEEQVLEGFSHVATELMRVRVTDEAQAAALGDLEASQGEQDASLAEHTDTLGEHRAAIGNAQAKVEDLAADLKQEKRASGRFQQAANTEFERHGNAIAGLEGDSIAQARQVAEHASQIGVLQHNEAANRSWAAGEIVRLDENLGGLAGDMDGMGEDIDGLGEDMDGMGADIDGLGAEIDQVTDVLAGINFSNMAAIGLLEAQGLLQHEAQEWEIEAVAGATLENGAMLMAQAENVATLDLELDALAEAWNQTADGLAEDIDEVAEDVEQTRNTMAAANDSLHNRIDAEARIRGQADHEIVSVMSGMQGEIHGLTAIDERQDEIMARELRIEGELNDTLGQQVEVDERLATEIETVARIGAEDAEALATQMTSVGERLEEHLGEQAHELMGVIQNVKGQCLAHSAMVEATASAHVADLQEQILAARELDAARVLRISQLEAAQAERVQTIENLTSHLARTNAVVNQLVAAFEELAAIQQEEGREIMSLANRPRVIVDVEEIQQPPPMFVGREIEREIMGAIMG